VYCSSRTKPGRNPRRPYSERIRTGQSIVCEGGPTFPRSPAGAKYFHGLHCIDRSHAALRLVICSVSFTLRPGRVISEMRATSLETRISVPTALFNQQDSEKNEVIWPRLWPASPTEPVFRKLRSLPGTRRTTVLVQAEKRCLSVPSIHAEAKFQASIGSLPGEQVVAAQIFR